MSETLNDESPDFSDQHAEPNTAKDSNKSLAPVPQQATSSPMGMYLVITNISKSRNVKSLLLTAAAFGCKAVLVVGQPSFDFDPNGRDIPRKIKQHIRDGHLPIQRFEKWKDCVSYLEERGVRLIGVEIHDSSQLIEEIFDATHAVAFVFGNEGQGLNEKQMASCDGFVRIPQYGGGTASLNVYVAASIVLHRYFDFMTEQEQQCVRGSTNRAP